MKKKLELTTNEAYKSLVETFKLLRESNGATGLDIQIATKTGGGRVFRFEGLEYTPTLNTFVKWCWAAGITINLNHAPKKHNLKKVIRKRQAEAEDPGSLIDEIKEQNNNQK